MMFITRLGYIKSIKKYLRKSRDYKNDAVNWLRNLIQ